MSLAKAYARYKGFQGRAPKKVTRINIPKIGPIVYLGKGLAIEYQSDKKMHRSDIRPTSRGYRHTFEKGVKIYTEPTGKALIVIGGRFKVTDWLRH